MLLNTRFHLCGPDGPLTYDCFQVKSSDIIRYIEMPKKSIVFNGSTAFSSSFVRDRHLFLSSLPVSPSSGPLSFRARTPRADRTSRNFSLTFLPGTHTMIAF